MKKTYKQLLHEETLSDDLTKIEDEIKNLSARLSFGTDENEINETEDPIVVDDDEEIEIIDDEDEAVVGLAGDEVAEALDEDEEIEEESNCKSLDWLTYITNEIKDGNLRGLDDAIRMLTYFSENGTTVSFPSNMANAVKEFKKCSAAGQTLVIDDDGIVQLSEEVPSSTADTTKIGFDAPKSDVEDEQTVTRPVELTELQDDYQEESVSYFGSIQAMVQEKTDTLEISKAEKEYEIQIIEEQMLKLRSL